MAETMTALETPVDKGYTKVIMGEDFKKASFFLGPFILPAHANSFGMVKWKTAWYLVRFGNIVDTYQYGQHRPDGFSLGAMTNIPKKHKFSFVDGGSEVFNLPQSFRKLHLQAPPSPLWVTAAQVGVTQELDHQHATTQDDWGGFDDDPAATLEHDDPTATLEHDDPAALASSPVHTYVPVPPAAHSMYALGQAAAVEEDEEDAPPPKRSHLAKGAPTLRETTLKWASIKTEVGKRTALWLEFNENPIKNRENTEFVKRFKLENEEEPVSRLPGLKSTQLSNKRSRVKLVLRELRAAGTPGYEMWTQNLWPL